MVIYLLYFKSNPEFKDDIYTMYAYTDDKTMLNEFKSQRDMKKFKIKKEDISKEEYKIFDRNNKKMKLTYANIYTSDKLYGKRRSVKVLCTWREEEYIFKNSERLWEEYSRYLFDVRLFKSKYLIALEKLLFVKFYMFYKNNQNRDYFYEPYYNNFGPVEDLILDDLKSSYSYDELSLFLKFFGNTFDMDTVKF